MLNLETFMKSVFSPKKDARSHLYHLMKLNIVSLDLCILEFMVYSVIMWATMPITGANFQFLGFLGMLLQVIWLQFTNMNSCILHSIRDAINLANLKCVTFQLSLTFSHNMNFPLS